MSCLDCRGGDYGLTVARELLRRGLKDILLLEKEPSLGMHASGRNSGVLHAGMYYTPDTLKAKYCVMGNRLMKELCREKGLTLKETGKVILGRNPAEVEALHELKKEPTPAAPAPCSSMARDSLKSSRMQHQARKRFTRLTRQLSSLWRY